MPDPRVWPITLVDDYYATVAGVSSIIVPARPAGIRQDCDITNDGDDLVYLGRGNEAVVGSGIRLNPNGGTYHLGLFNLFEGDIYAISDNKQEVTNVAITEGYRVTR